MQVTADEMRRHYASLSDEMLQEMDPADLTDVARNCYESEIAKRRQATNAAALHAGAEEHAEESFEAEPDWLEHAGCACSYMDTPGSNHAPDAERARDALLAAGIPCELSEIPPGRAEEGAPRFAEYRVMVPAPLLLRATSVLDQEIFNAEVEAEWQAHFAQLSDQELRALNPAVICAGLRDRVERLTRSYNEEKERRGLLRPS